MKKIIYWTLPIWAFVAQYLLMGILVAALCSVYGTQEILPDEFISTSLSSLIIPIIGVIIFPYFAILPIGGIIMGYIYIRAVKRSRSVRAVNNATILLSIVGVAFTSLVVIFFRVNFVLILFGAIPILYIVPLVIATIKCRKWVSNVELPKE